MGYVWDKIDCDDINGNVYLFVIEEVDNGVDEDCFGSDLLLIFKVYLNFIRD